MYLEKNDINPFQSRWRLDDREWVKNRKQQWLEVKVRLAELGKSAKEIKALKAFWLTGEIPHSTLGDSIFFRNFEWFIYTPCESEEQAWELVNHLACDEYTVKNMLGVAAFANAHGQEEYLAKALIPDHYEERKLRTTSKHREDYVDFYFSADKFVDEYEGSWYLFLSHQNISFEHCTVQYNFEHYLSCLKHLEQQRIAVVHRADLKHALNMTYHCVEPRLSWDNAARRVSQFARRVVERLQQDDIPLTLRQQIEALGDQQLFEYSRNRPPSENILCGDKRIGGEKSLPDLRILHGFEPTKALAVMVSAAQTVELLPTDYTISEPEQCDLSGWISEGLAAAFGYESGTVPAWRFTFWFSPKERLCSSDSARVGADVYIPVPLPGRIYEKETPSLIYRPRLTAEYRELYPSEVYFLKERQWRRQVFDASGHYLLGYSDDEDFYAHLPRNFVKYQSKNMSYNILGRYDFDFFENAIEGDGVKPWHGEPLPMVEWNKVLQDV